MKQKMNFRARYQRFEVLLYPNCENSKTLLKIMDKSCLSGVKLLPLIHKLGFDINLIPDSRAILEEVRNKNINFKLDKEGISILND